MLTPFWVCLEASSASERDVFTTHIYGELCIHRPGCPTLSTSELMQLLPQHMEQMRAALTEPLPME